MGASQKIAIKFDRFLTIGIQPSLYFAAQDSKNLCPIVSEVQGVLSLGSKETYRPFRQIVRAHYGFPL